MLRIMTYNIKFGGEDDGGAHTASRLPLIHQVVRQVKPDILAIQEANGFEQHDQRRLFGFERALGMRSVFGFSPHGFHGAIFLKPGFEPVSLRNDDPLGNHVLMGLVLRTPGGMELAVHNVHLDPYAAQQRLDGMMRCLSVPPSIVLGDFNNLRPDDPDAEQNWRASAPALRARDAAASGDRIDGRLFNVLEHAGYVDLFRRVHAYLPGATLKPGGGLRLDYIYATSDLADQVRSCEVADASPAEKASDHLPVVAELDID